MMLRLFTICIFFMFPMQAQELPPLSLEQLEERARKNIVEQYQQNARRAEGGAGGRYRSYSSSMSEEEQREYEASPWYGKLWHGVKGIFVQAGFLLLLFIPAILILMFILFFYKKLTSTEDENS